MIEVGEGGDGQGRRRIVGSGGEEKQCALVFVLAGAFGKGSELVWCGPP